MSTMSIIGGVVGGAIGFMLGGPVGAAVGVGMGVGIGMMANPIAPDAPAPGQPDVAELSVNQVKEGAIVADVLGTTKITSSATYLWYGKSRMKEIIEEVEQETGGKGGGGGGETQERVVGYKYYLTWALGICKGPVDTCQAIYKIDFKVGNPFHKPPSGGEVAINIGGSMGAARFFFGTDDQMTVSDLGVAYRELCYIYFDDCYIGGYNRAPNMRFIVTKRPVFSFNTHNEIGDFDYNPAHALWYIMTEMLGLPESYLDSTSFSDVADTLWSSSIGISISFDRQQSAIIYIESILKHIDGIIRYGNDGKFHLKLIRDDIEESLLPVVTKDEILDGVEINRKSWLDVTNEVKIQYARNLYDGGGT